MEKYKKEELERYIFEENMPYDKIGEKYGVTGTFIRKKSKQLGIDLPKRRGINPNETFNKGKIFKDVYCKNCGRPIPANKGTKFCNMDCFQEYQYKENIRKWQNGEIEGYRGKEGSRVSNFIRRYIFEKNENKCECCHREYVNPYTKLSILQIHHKDGDAMNNKEENLQLLCPNCHAMTENFGSRNKNSSRQYRRDEYRKSKNKAL